MKKFYYVFALMTLMTNSAILNAEDCHYRPRYDLSGDCQVNLVDFALMAQDWLIDCQAFPEEPACIPLDLDNDNYDVTQDCDDNNSEVYPGAPEDCYNAIDDDCDGLIDSDDPDCNYCGDGYCTNEEDAMTCPEDCESTCGDSFCTHAEDAGDCPDDCPPMCGDGFCTHAETALDCPFDCPPICGDGFCSPEEDFISCPQDCQTGAICGDGFCDYMMGEDEYNCPSDCGGGTMGCGDGFCDYAMGEDPQSCPQDCQPQMICGDGYCEPDEIYSCPEDCDY